jgi:thiosulfate/3-mercaptopyruvate sulfurtransferase
MSFRTLIDVAQLRELLGRDDVLVVDCRYDLGDLARGPREYAAQHLPGAIHADLNADLSDLSKPGLGRHPLPDAAAFGAVLGRWGWTPRLQVVAYDDAGGALAAARLWWMLRLVGHRDVAVLDGGIGAWREAGLPLDSERARRSPGTVDVAFDAGRIVYTEELQRDRKKMFLLDARAAPRFRGETETIDPVAGHVPGARNRPFAENLQAGRFKPADALRADFGAVLGDAAPQSVVHMCGSGVTACQNLLAMEHAGLRGSRVYAPSWSGWIADPSRPVGRGAE